MGCKDWADDRKSAKRASIGCSSPFRLFDDNYAGFLDLVARQIGAAVANAEAYEQERRRADALAALDNAKTLFFFQHQS